MKINLLRLVEDSKPSPERHPERLALLALLSGFKSPNPDTARILELGCGTGSHLIAMSLAAPNSKLVGIDLDEESIAAGRAVCQQLGIKNVDLRCADLSSALDESQQFDYIFVHGVYSWVAPVVREQILEVIDRKLSPTGVAAVSYNALPACFPRLALHHNARLCDDITQPLEKRIETIRQLFDFTEEQLSEDLSHFGLQMKSEIQNCRAQTDEFLARELLSPVNDGIYFSEIVEAAGKRGLQYLGDGRPSRIRFDQLPSGSTPAKPLNLSSPRAQVVANEQQMDLVRPAPFRLTCFCRIDIPLQEKLSLQVDDPIYLSSPLVPDSPSPEIFSRQKETFHDPREYAIEVSGPFLKALLVELHEKWPTPILLSELCAQVHKRLHPGAEEPPIEVPEPLLAELVSLFRNNLVNLTLSPPNFTTEIEQTPIAHPLARIEAQLGYWVVNYRHEFSVLNEFQRRALVFLDGTQDRPSIEDKLFAMVKSGELGMKEDGRSINEVEQQREIIAEHLTESLHYFASQALLTAKKTSE